jgi:hypothetical protein
MTTNNDRYLIGFLLGTILTATIVHILIHNAYDDTCYHEDMFPPLVKPEYIIEVQGDSAFVQNRYGDVYKAKVSEIDSIIVYDNL